MRAYPIARSELQSMLLDANKPAPVHLSKMAVSYTTSDEGVTVNFQDGTSDTGDFVIISDGTHSKLRNQLTGKDIKRDYVGYVNFNGTIEKAPFKVSFLLSVENGMFIHGRTFSQRILGHSLSARANALGSCPCPTRISTSGSTSQRPWALHLRPPANGKHTSANTLLAGRLPCRR